MKHTESGGGIKTLINNTNDKYSEVVLNGKLINSWTAGTNENVFASSESLWIIFRWRQKCKYAAPDIKHNSSPETEKTQQMWLEVRRVPVGAERCKQEENQGEGKQLFF